MIADLNFQYSAFTMALHIRNFYHDKYKKDMPGKTEDEILKSAIAEVLKIGITDLQVKMKHWLKRELKLTVVCVHPGILIGKAGANIDKLTQYITDYYKNIPFKPVKVSISIKENSIPMDVLPQDYSHYFDDEDYSGVGMFDD